MSFVKSQKELDQYYNLGVRHFPGARMLGVLYQTKPEIIERLLPSPLEPIDQATCMMFVAEYAETNLGPGYKEAALFLNCQYQGEKGNYCLSMPIDNEPRMHNGRDIFGFPKKMAKIDVDRDGEKLKASVERRGTRFLEIKAEMTATMPALPESGPTFLFKGMPRADLQPGFDGPVYLVSQKTEIEVEELKIGDADVQFFPSEEEPWAEVECVETLIGFDLTSNNTMKPGEILTEVDPEKYLPHYFRMTDFSTGA